MIQSEFGNIVWEIHQRDLIDPFDAVEIVQQFLMLPVEIHSSDSLIASAVELAVGTGRAVYDCLYIALAIDQDGEFLTADKRLVNALAGSPLARHIRLLGIR